MTSSGRIKLLEDALIIEAIFAEPKFHKNASVVDSLENYVKNYFSAKISEGHPIEDILSLVTPTLVLEICSAMGFPFIGAIAGLLMNVFDVNVGSLVEDVKSKVKNNKKISETDLKASVDKAAQNAEEQSSEEKAEDDVIDYNEKFSSKELIHHAKMLKLAYIDFEHQNLRLVKDEFDIKQSNFYKLASIKGKSSSLLIKIVGFIIKTILKSAGLLVVGDMIRHVMGKPPAHLSPESKQQLGISPHVSTQKKYPPKSDDAIPPSINESNTPSNIENILVQFVKDAYSGLDGKENLIKSNPKFDRIKRQVILYNERNEGYSVIYMPSFWKTKKEMADTFIDDVAAADK